MDILYVIGEGSEWSDNELRYSLRSIAKYGKNIGRVYIVGYKPPFVSNEVTYIPCDDPYDRPHKNILHKVLTVIERSDIGSHFLISSDDHYYVQETDFDNLPVYYKKECIPSVVRGRDLWNQYHKSLRETYWLLHDNGLTTWQTNPHCNTHFDVEVYKANRKLFERCMQLQFGGELNCVMGNLLISKGAVPVEFKDSKLSRKARLEDIMQRATECECLSSYPDMPNSALAQYLAEEFNTKCIYEL